MWLITIQSKNDVWRRIQCPSRAEAFATAERLEAQGWTIWAIFKE